MDTQNDAAKQEDNQSQLESLLAQSMVSPSGGTRNGGVQPRSAVNRLQPPSPPPLRLMEMDTSEEEDQLPTPPASLDDLPNPPEPALVLQRSKGALSLRAKATVLAIALATLPVLGIGMVAYLLADQFITKQITQTKQEKTTELVDQVNRFMADRYEDIQVLANLSLFTDPKQRLGIPFLQKQAILDSYIRSYRVYSSIAFFDLNGNLIAQS
ncbi:MAG: hypothetical protein VKJ46_13200, partial [Leptolyngbyaceae bacterium]|nr:hypothetical protein [Leptolyngbyaceae bacterium]